MWIKLVGGITLAAAIAALVTYQFVCPCDRVPGGSLSGEVVAAPADWSFVNDKATVPLCQIEVAFFIPRSMNVNCMSIDEQLYVSCSQCAGKQWAARALEYPLGRVRAAGKVSDIRYTRVVDDVTLDRIWHARALKFGRDPKPRPDHWWSFQLGANH